MEVGGKNWTHNFISHADLVTGKDIVFRMGSQPSISRGTAAEDRPYSFSRK